MGTEMVINGEKRPPYRRDIYREFILWTAMPNSEKIKLGIERQEDFCEYYKIGHNTPTRWKERADFESRVDAILKMWSTDKTPDVVHSIYRSAVKGNPMSQMLWLQYFKKFNPRAEPEEEKKVVLSPADIRYAIEQLPEQLRQKHYGYLRELTEDISAIRNAKLIEDDHWNARPEETVPVETDSDAQNISSNGTNAVAPRYPTSVCADLVRKASESDYKSASGWREK